MLILKRKAGQSVRIGDNLYLTVISHDRHEVVFSTYDELTGTHCRITGKVSDSVKISPAIYVMPTHRNGREVSLGFDVPRDVKVLRTEII